MKYRDSWFCQVALFWGLLLLKTHLLFECWIAESWRTKFEILFWMATNTLLLSGDNDWLAQPADILKLISHLPNIVENYKVRQHIQLHRLFTSGETALQVFIQFNFIAESFFKWSEVNGKQSWQCIFCQVPWEGWNHFDFLYAIDIDLYQNEHLIEVLRENPIN